MLFCLVANTKAEAISYSLRKEAIDSIAERFSKRKYVHTIGIKYLTSRRTDSVSGDFTSLSKGPVQTGCRIDHCFSSLLTTMLNPLCPLFVQKCHNL